MERDLFYQEVYSIVKLIPSGCVMTYGQIARLMGKPQCSRIVGQAMFHAPEGMNLPCHRVVNSRGRIVPSWHEQQTLLEQEGITFKENGCVNLKQHLWKIEDSVS